ncbi:MAG: hypothetical protein ACI38Y_03965 [Candidatus Methanomethylophilaceae archaeon]
MSKRFGIPVAVLVLALALFAPVVQEGSDAAEQSFYMSQLDVNGCAVFNALGGLLGNYSNTAEVDVTFDSITLFEDEGSARAYAGSVVDDALAAKYYSEPLIPHLWDLPVSYPEVKVNTSEVTLSDNPVKYYIVTGVSIVLSVPEDMGDDPGTDTNELEKRINEVKEAVRSFSPSGGNDADKVKSIAGHLRSVKSVDDEEGQVSNIYDAVVSKRSSSAGVAAAFTYYCMANSIESVTVRGLVYDGSDSSVEYWNAVRTGGSWYAVDTVMYNQGNKAYLMAGSATQVVAGETPERLSTTHVADLDLSQPNGLDAPDLSRDGYPYPDDTPFLEKYGGWIILTLIIGIAAVFMVKAAKGDE